MSEESAEKQWPKDWNAIEVEGQVRGKQREQLDFNQAVNQVKENNSRNAKAKTEVDKLIKTARPQIKNFSAEIMQLKLKVIHQMV